MIVPSCSSCFESCSCQPHYHTSQLMELFLRLCISVTRDDGGKVFNFQVKVKAAGHWHILLPSKLTKGNNNTKMEHRVGLFMPLNSSWNKKNTTVLNHRLWGCPALTLWNLVQHIRKWRTIQISHWFCRYESRSIVGYIHNLKTLSKNPWLLALILRPGNVYEATLTTCVKQCAEFSWKKWLMWTGSQAANSQGNCRLLPNHTLRHSTLTKS